MAYIKRGEAKTVPVRVKFNDMDVFPIGNVDEIAFKLGDSVRKSARFARRKKHSHKL